MKGGFATVSLVPGVGQRTSRRMIGPAMARWIDRGIEPIEPRIIRLQSGGAEAPRRLKPAKACPTRLKPAYRNSDPGFPPGCQPNLRDSIASDVTKSGNQADD